MTRRLFVYVTCFTCGFAVWIVLNAFKTINPLLPLQYPFLIPVLGLSFPGGATPSLYFLNHVAET